MSRMDRYNENVKVKDRMMRNSKLYDEVSDINVSYINLDNGVEIDTDKIRTNKRSDYHKMKELEDIIPLKDKEVEEEKEKEEHKENRVYDINEVLRLARENKLFQEDDKKRLLNTEYNILTKLDIEKINQAKDLKKEDLKTLINEIYVNEEKTSKKGKNKKKSRADVLDDNKDLFQDLIDDNDLKPLKEEKDVDLAISDTNNDDSLELKIDEEISKKILDKENGKELSKKDNKIDNTNTNITTLIKKEEDTMEKTFTSYDFKTQEETFEEDSAIINDKRSKALLIVVVLFVLVLGGIIAYLLYKYFTS